MAGDLHGRRIAVLATDGFEQSELTEPVRELRHAGAVVDVVSPKSWPSLKTDLANAGARWIDGEAVVDNGLLTSRKPADLAAFCHKAVELFSGATAA